MKKKWLLTGGAIGISSAVMLTTGFTALAGSSGYEDYKSALKTTQAAKSVTVQAEAYLQDNGTMLEQGQGTLKVNLQSEAKSGSFQVTGKSGSESVNVFAQNNGEVWKTSLDDTYYLKQDKPDKGNNHGNTSEWMDPQTETVIDALVGNLKDYVQEESQSDGSKHISMQLDSAQIPAVVQALAPMALKHLSDQENRDGHHSSNDASDPEKMFGKNLILSQSLSLTKDIQIKSVKLDATINPTNQIVQQQISVTFTGTDANGAAHAVTFDANANLSAFDQTVPDTIDLTGKTVKKLQERHGWHERDES